MALINANRPSGESQQLMEDTHVLQSEEVFLTTASPNPFVRPHPSQYVSEWTAKDGTQITIRPIRPGDEPLMGQISRNSFGPDSLLALFLFH
jgi:acetyltransferase